ncbi:MAG: glutamate 5-kinase [Clostridia bacterium]|nr:glutamate 5-kinase [Clostridia bacterium]
MNKNLYIIKIGTSSLTSKNGDIDREKIREIVRQVSDVRDAGHDCVIVTSGSIAAGFRALGYTSRPSSVAAKQASAAVGQGLLMEEYARFFSERGYVCAQILLTRGDFTDKRRYKNAFSALEILLSRGAVPIINENDTIAVEELHVGDNDTLSAQVAAMLHADLLILLTDTDGLYTANPSSDPTARHIPVIEHITPEIEGYAGGAGSKNGTGGMITKVKGASLATRAGVPVFICSSKDENVIVRAVSGDVKGTLFKADGSLKTRLQWMAFYAPSRGNIFVDKGAAEALTHHGKSLLAAGVTAVEGDFARGDVVKIVTSGDHNQIGRGIAGFSKSEMNDILDRGDSRSSVVIHKDDLVLTVLQ